MHREPIPADGGEPLLAPGVDTVLISLGTDTDIIGQLGGLCRLSAAEKGRRRVGDICHCWRIIKRIALSGNGGIHKWGCVRFQPAER